MKRFKNTGYKLALEGPFEAESKEDLLFRFQDEFINILLYQYRVTPGSKILLEKSKRMCEELEKFLVEVE